MKGKETEQLQRKKPLEQQVKKRVSKDWQNSGSGKEIFKGIYLISTDFKASRFSEISHVPHSTIRIKEQKRDTGLAIIGTCIKGKSQCS